MRSWNGRRPTSGELTGPGAGSAHEERRPARLDCSAPRWARQKTTTIPWPRLGARLRRKRPAHPAVATAALAWGLPRRWTSSPRDRSL